jgi:hypothetical protein
MHLVCGQRNVTAQELAGERKRYCAVLFSCAVYCDLSVTGDDTLNNHES